MFAVLGGAAEAAVRGAIFGGVIGMALFLLIKLGQKIRGKSKPPSDSEQT